MVMLQIRNVPEDIHRQLKARAALAGQSLSEFALTELRKSLERPTRADVLARIAARAGTAGSVDVVATIAADRQERDRSVGDAVGR